MPRLLLFSIVKYEAVDAGNVAQLAARRVALTRPLDLDDVGAEPRQNLGAGRSRRGRCVMSRMRTPSGALPMLSLSSRCGIDRCETRILFAELRF